MSEKIILTPDGFLIESFEEEDSKLIEKNDPQVFAYLRSFCEIDPYTTLWDIMDTVRNNEMLSLFLSKYCWCPDINLFHQELDKKPIINENDKVDCLEVYWSSSNHEPTKELSIFAEFHGIGSEFEEEDENIKETFSLSASPLNEYAHLKVKLNKQVKLYSSVDLSKKYKKPEVILDSEKDFTLLDILDAIYWDISYYGPPESRDLFMDELTEKWNNIKNDLSFEDLDLEDVDFADFDDLEDYEDE